MVDATTDLAPVNHAGLVDVDPAADLEVEFALGHRGHPQSLHDPGACGDFRSMANTRAWLPLLPKPAGEAQQVSILADMLWRPPATEKNAGILLRLDLLESEIRLDAVPPPTLS